MSPVLVAAVWRVEPQAPALVLSRGGRRRGAHLVRSGDREKMRMRAINFKILSLIKSVAFALSEFMSLDFDFLIKFEGGSYQ